VYGLIMPIPRWLLTGASLFCDWESWTRMIARHGHGPLRGRLTISGFRRPEALMQFIDLFKTIANKSHMKARWVFGRFPVEIAHHERKAFFVSKNRQRFFSFYFFTSKSKNSSKKRRVSATSARLRLR
jgi:hypothetical protein